MFLALAVTAATTVFAAENDWKMFDRRLGMFIHWGCYSVGEWHCQELWRRNLSRADYEKRFAPNFNAAKFNADEFVAVAKSAGAEYIVFTSKHHDGFCMWDTKTTDYKITNTPTKRDVIKELAEACRRGGIRLGFYYSNPDWHCSFSNNPKSSHQLPMQPGDKPDMEKYIAYVKAQVTELLSNYGDICCWFWDIPTNIDRPEMDELVRRLQPGIMINDRGWGNKKTADYSTPERDYAWAGGNKYIECCDATGVQSWGYRRNEDYHTHGYFTRNIDSYLATGANYLLNVGPKPDGTIPDEAKAIMAKVGSWMARVRESYRGVENAPELVGKVTHGEKRTITRRGKTLYVHFPKGIEADGLSLAPIKDLPKKAVLLNTGRELSCEVTDFPWSSKPGSAAETYLHVRGIPADDLANECVVIRLEY